MKYILLLLALACQQKPKQEMVVGKATDGGRFPIAGWNTGKYIVVNADSGMLQTKEDGTITITGDTMAVIKMMLEENMKLYEENQELKRIIKDNETSIYHNTAFGGMPGRSGKTKLIR